MSHTPGPWKVREDGGIFESDILGPNGEDIAYVNASDGADEPKYYPVNENAALIAAAPDLLALGKRVLAELPELWGDLVQDGWVRLTVAEEDIDALKTAIAKAEGR